MFRYRYACLVCGRVFLHETANPRLKAHKNPQGFDCHGRAGRYGGRERR